MKPTKKKIIERVFILSVAVIVLTMLVFFLKDIIFPFVRMQINNDKDGAQALLVEKGWLGFIAVSLIEALQMVVIFIPAEFIQLTSGMSYPWWQAIILCDIGVILGSSIIYLLVNIFKFDGDILNKGSKIKSFEKKSRVNNTIIFMFILFIMPIIPFGAICYYASNKKIPYWKYVLTCAIAVIPSICTSIFMGYFVKLFLSKEIPIIYLILAIIGAAAILFALLVFVLKKFFFKQDKGTPDSVYYSMSLGLGFKLLKLRYKVKVIGKEKLANIDGPYLMLANHHSFLDPFAVSQIDKKQRFAYVYNRYFLRLPVFGRMLTNAGLIPKRMFTPDFECASKIIRMLKAGYSVPIFPEARLSTDGGPSEIEESTSKLVKLVKVPAVLIQVRKSYFLKPKWRPARYGGKIEVEIMDVIQPEQAKEMSLDEIQKKIVNSLSFNAFDSKDISFKKKNLAKGLENALYMCPHCGTLYSNISDKNTLTCSHCGKSYHVKPNYQFEEEDISNIHDYYGKIKEIELKDIESKVFDIEVDTLIFEKDMRKTRKEKGVFHLDKDHITYKSSTNDTFFEYETTKLQGIAYSANEEFEMWHNGELYYFYPSKDDRRICTRIALIHELLRDKAYGKH